MPEEFRREDFSLKPKRLWYKTGYGVSFLILIGLLSIIIIAFVTLMTYYAWQIRYGDANQLALQFEKKKISVSSNLANNSENKVIVPDIQKYIQSFNPVLGDVKAPITIIEFIDFQCQYCQEAYRDFNAVKEKYSAVLRVVFKHLPLVDLHPDTMSIANAAACAGEQGKFWQYYDLLFTNKKFSADDLISYADELGLNKENLNTCLQNILHQSEIDKDSMDAVNLGVQGTPTYFVNGIKIEGVLSEAEWDKIILELLNEK